MFMLVFAAIGVFGAGMLAIAAGIPIKEFGFGNTLILSGVLAWCTSTIMLTLWACCRDIRLALQGDITRPVKVDAERALPETSGAASGWPESIPERAAPPPPPPAVEAPPQKRNLLFSSNRRPKEATPAEITSAPSLPTATPPLDLRPAVMSEEPRPAPRRPDPPPRTLRPASAIVPREPAPSPPAPPPPPSAAEKPVATPPAPREPEPTPPPRAALGRTETAPGVTVLKSGVVDGMAYWLYSDGSIEAQMPEGMMRFTSIDELRAHLDKRP